MPSLFELLRIRDLNIPNRVCVSPMSQYRAQNGVGNDWHFAHLSRFALGGAGLIFAEATAVCAEGRRTHGDLGLWEDGQIEPLRRVTDFLKSEGAAAGVQLAHAGRKASERRPWHGETPVNDEDTQLRGEAPWQALGPTAEPYGDGWPEPTAMTEADIEDVIQSFEEAARRADAAGFDVIEVYAAHGFLLHQFYSPLCNTRTDDWGGCYEGRARLSLEVATAIRRAWPDGKPLFFRLSATDWIDGGWAIDDTIRLASDLKARGVDLIDCSSGGIGGPHPLPRFPLGPAYQADLAAQVRAGTDIPTMAVGFIWQAQVANQVITDGQADLVALARELLNDPNWTLRAAAELGVDTDHALWKPEFGWWLNKRERVMRKLGLRD
jgi:2,4-dienoyl-CoA reductase-like NADH-dependent reductase (Old Yellow Enzyme family)